MKLMSEELVKPRSLKGLVLELVYCWNWTACRVWSLQKLSFGPEDQRTAGPEDQSAGGPRDRSTGGPREQRTRRPEDQKITGPEDQRTADQRTRRPEDQKTRGPRDRRTRRPQGQENQKTRRSEDQRTTGPEDPTKGEPHLFKKKPGPVMRKTDRKQVINRETRLMKLRHASSHVKNCLSSTCEQGCCGRSAASLPLRLRTNT